MNSVKLSDNYLYVCDENRVYHVTEIKHRKRQVNLSIVPVILLSKVNEDVEIIYLDEIPTGIVKKAVNLFNRLYKSNGRLSMAY